jgi:hypothetical protein
LISVAMCSVVIFVELPQWALGDRRSAAAWRDAGRLPDGPTGASPAVRPAARVD